MNIPNAAEIAANLVPAVLERVNDFELASTYKLCAKVTVKIKNLVHEIMIDSEGIRDAGLFKKMESFGFSPDWTSLKAEYDIWAKIEEEKFIAEDNKKKLEMYNSSWINQAIVDLNNAGYQASPNISRKEFMENGIVSGKVYPDYLYVNVKKDDISFCVIQETRGRHSTKMTMYKSDYPSKVWSVDLIKLAKKAYDEKIEKQSRETAEKNRKENEIKDHEDLFNKIKREIWGDDVIEIKKDIEYNRYNTNVVRAKFRNGMVVTFTGSADKANVYLISHPKMHTAGMVDLLRKVQ
jgi:hypothetical protein